VCASFLAVYRCLAVLLPVARMTAFTVSELLGFLSSSFSC
jgi:hypothetical protein